MVSLVWLWSRCARFYHNQTKLTKTPDLRRYVSRSLKLVRKLRKILIVCLLLIAVLFQGCSLEPKEEALSNEASLAILESSFGEIDQLSVYDGKTIEDYTSDRTVIHFQLVEDMSPEDWLSFLVQKYADRHSGDQGYIPFYPVNIFQYKNDEDGKGSEIITLTYNKSTDLYEIDLYIYY